MVQEERRLEGMTTAVIDERRYGKLLLKTLPRVIGTERDNERMIAELEKLDLRWDDLSQEEKELAELMTALIERFESEHYPINLATPQQRLAQLMEDRGLTQADVWHLLGTRRGRPRCSKASAASARPRPRNWRSFFGRRLIFWVQQIFTEVRQVSVSKELIS
jgi:HTH-type transcriptional regulator/antitoxin HigA